MKKIVLILSVSAMCYVSFAQQEDSKALNETANSFVRQGDYTNAIVVYNRALEKDPQNLELLKGLSFAYYLQRDFVNALKIAKPLPERPDADVQSFQILGMVYKILEEKKELEKMYKAGLKKFPGSGMLYDEYGEVMGTDNGPEAIKLWEKGIEMDPNCSSNYYNASKYYYTKNEKVWCVLYGEIFVNIESYSTRTKEMKEILLEAYKKFFADAALFKTKDVKNKFVAMYLNEVGDQSETIAHGISTASLIDLRTKFILSWFNKPAVPFAFRLFDYQRQLIKEGLFDAYNQWLFGEAQDPQLFKDWTGKHAAEYQRFIDFQSGRIFKLPPGQYYQAPLN